VQTPYNNLHIYYIRGHVSGDPAREMGSGFIGNWQEPEAAFLFFTQPADERVEALIDSQPALELIDKFEMSYSDWHGGEIRSLITDRFHVTPPWAKPSETGGRLFISLDPGVVFGAGTHPTTQACLEALEILWEQKGVESAVDLGTGTGLLAIAASRLGCLKVLAVDNNELAVRTAFGNIKANGLASRVMAVCADARQMIASPAELLIANIHYDVMKELLASPDFYEKKYFILSGLLRTQARQVEELIYYGPGRIIQRWINDGVWYTFLGACGG
jgi:ribosomal protein L11 methyltransferase